MTKSAERSASLRKKSCTAAHRFARHTVTIGIFFSTTLYLSHASAQQQRQELALTWSSLSFTLTTAKESVSFLGVLGGNFLYRYAILPRVALELGYELQSGGTKLLTHGPDVGIFYSFYGQPSFSINDAPISIKITYPFEAYIGLGTLIREYDFSPLFPPSAALLTETRKLVEKGNVFGLQTLLGINYELSTNTSLLIRMRYLQGFTSNISGGSIRAWGPQCGLTVKL